MRRSALIAVFFFVATQAFGAGFQLPGQSARAMGMGNAYTAVADDASAVYYNPAGLAFQKTNFVAGALIFQKLKGELETAAGIEKQAKGNPVAPELYGMTAFGKTKVGIGVFSPFGLPIRWENPETFTGRSTSYNVNLRTVDINPTVAWAVTPNLGIGVGVDYLYSKFQAERFARVPPTSPLNFAHLRIKGDLLDSHGWGWNAGAMWKSGPLTLGASYRSTIEIENTSDATFQFLQPSPQPLVPVVVRVTIEFPSSLNLGGSWTTPGGVIFAVDADRTDFSSFDELQLRPTGLPVPTPAARVTDWDDTWAYRTGVEFPCGSLRCRGGYYYEETPQPIKDVGPVLPDANQQFLSHSAPVSIG